MQDRYAGDVGDFLKLGLLRAVVDDGRTGLRLGVNWYLVPDEAHNADGKHVAYLDRSHRHHRSLAACDPDLMMRLRQVFEGMRSVAALEESGALPASSITFADRLRAGLGDGARSIWHDRALLRLAEADLVFVDPDNGMRAGQGGSKPHKYAYAAELADYAARGQSLIVYHHADHTRGGVQAQVARRLRELSVATGTPPLGAIVTRRGSCRFFLVVPAPNHRSRLSASLDAHISRWADHAELVTT